MLVADYRFRAHGHQNDQLLIVDENSSPKISWFSAFSLLIHVSLSTNYLGFGVLFDGGIVQTILICLVPLVMIQISFHIFFRTWVFGSEFSYSGIWVLVFGPTFSFLPSLLIVIALLDFPFNISSMVPKTLQTIIQSNLPSAPSFLSSKWFLIYAVNCVFVLPFLAARRFSTFRSVSFIGNLAFLTGLVALILAAMLQHGRLEGTPLPTFGGSMDHAAALFSIINTAFFMHPVVAFVTQDMYNPTNGRTCGLVWTVCLVKLLLLIFIGLTSYYYYFGPGIGNAYFSDLMGQQYTETIVLRMALVIKELLTNGCYVWMIAYLVTTILVPTNESQICVFLMGLAFLLFAISISFTSLQVRTIISMITSIAKVIVVQIIPPIYYLRLFKLKEPQWAFPAILLLVCGVIASAFILYDAIRACKSAFSGIFSGPATGVPPIGDFSDNL